MTANRTVRLSKIGAVLAARMPAVLDAAIVLLESVAPALDAAHPQRYEIDRKIGEGGEAEVLLGTVRGPSGFHRLVAVKRVRSGQASADRSAARLLQEARLASRFSHPNVVSVLDYDRDKAGQPFLVMEYVDGVSLEKLVETGSVPRPVVIFIVRELLSGLGYIHQFRGQGGVRGLVHRDVSPHNVLLSWQGEVKLADFGVAQVRDKITTITAVNVPVGKAGYMSPEQTNREDLDGRSDLYAAGIVLWELLARRRLRVGPPSHLEARVEFQNIRPPSKYRSGIPADLEAVAMKLLAYHREERYRTADLAARDLTGCQDAPRDGRGDLARLLDKRFPRARRQVRARVHRNWTRRARARAS
jgi:serine/threonine protein kinase